MKRGDKTRAKIAAIRDMAARHMTAAEMGRVLGCDGSNVRRLALVHDIDLVIAPSSVRPANIWELGDDERRRLFAARAADGARKALAGRGA